METKCVSILLTKLNGRFGDFIYWAAGRRYTHASIRLDDMGEVYYSFHFKGLCEEQPGFFSPKRVARSVLYQIELPLPIYEKLEARLREFLQARECYRYSWLGLCLCLLGVPHRFPGPFSVPSSWWSC